MRHRRRAKLAHGVVEQCREVGARAIALPGDVSDGSASREAVRALIAVLGRLDVVVTNAGIVHRQPLVEMSEARPGTGWSP